MPSRYSFLTQREMLVHTAPLFIIIYLLSQPLCFQGISDNRKAGNTNLALQRSRDESDRAYPDIIVRMRSSPLLPKYKTNFSQCLVHFFDEPRHHLVKLKLYNFLFIPLHHDIMQAFTLHTRVIVGKIAGIFSRHPHAVLHWAM